WESGSNCGIWTINSDGSGIPAQLTNRSGDVSNDSFGNNLLLSSQQSGNWEVYAVSTGGGSLRNLTNSPSQDCCAAYSSDGGSIAFMSDRDGGWGIWIMNADGSSPHKLLAVPAGFGGDWSNERLAWGR
ncbi:MAG: PD40 domain-containing protein, partial [Anaerolineae bacterium]|nr:PD40 domain-containing protein [Anaerolineae bacterium]